MDLVPLKVFKSFKLLTIKLVAFALWVVCLVCVPVLSLAVRLLHLHSGSWDSEYLAACKMYPTVIWVVSVYFYTQCISIMFDVELSHVVSSSLAHLIVPLSTKTLPSCNSLVLTDDWSVTRRFLCVLPRSNLSLAIPEQFLELDDCHKIHFHSHSTLSFFLIKSHTNIKAFSRMVNSSKFHNINEQTIIFFPLQTSHSSSRHIGLSGNV